MFCTSFHCICPSDLLNYKELYLILLLASLIWFIWVSRPVYPSIYNRRTTPGTRAPISIRHYRPVALFDNMVFILSLFWLEYLITVSYGSLGSGTRRHESFCVMQSDENSFCGDVVLDSFNMSYRNEDIKSMFRKYFINFKF